MCCLLRWNMAKTETFLEWVCATLSMENGKSLVEVLSKVCHGCQRIELKMIWETKL